MGMAGTALGADRSVALNGDLYGGSAEVEGWGAGATLIGATAHGSPFTLGAAGVSLQDAHWEYLSCGRSFQAGKRLRIDAYGRLGTADLPGESGDFRDVAATLYAGALPGRLTLVLGDRYLDIGDSEGHLLQGGVDFVSAHRWAASLRVYEGISGDMDDTFATGSVILLRTAVTWTIGAAVGRTVPFRGAPSSVTQDSTEIYCTLGFPVGTQRMTVAASRFRGETTERRTLSAAWIVPLTAPPAGRPASAADDQ